MVDLELSKQLATDYYFSPGHCFFNAQGAVQVLAERGIPCRYVEGYARSAISSPVYHAWVEANMTIIDPTWVCFKDAEAAIYAPVSHVESGEICALDFDEMGAPFEETLYGTYQDYRRRCADAYQACMQAQSLF